MIIDHIGIVVRSIESGTQQWEELFGYRQATEIVTNTRQKVRVVFLSKDNSVTVKLIEPATDDSPIAALARRGGGLHHICFRCDNVQHELPILKNKGARVILQPEPGEAFKNHPIAFLFGANNLNFELIDTSEKEGWMEDLNRDMCICAE